MADPYTAAMEELWGGSRWPNGDLDDAAKLALAKHMLAMKERLPMTEAGGILREALGNRWLSAKQRHAKGMPTVTMMLQQDPYFQVKGEQGFGQYIELFLARLGDLALAMRSAKNAGPSASQVDNVQHPLRPGRPPCPRYSAHGYCSFGSKCQYDHSKVGSNANGSSSISGDRASSSGVGATAALAQRAPASSAPVLLPDDFEYPVRPGQQDCTPYTMVGYCQQGAACKSNHPPLSAEQRALHAKRKHERQKWDQHEPDAKTLGPHGLPLRPNADECPHYTKYGACGFGVVCMYDHPLKGTYWANTAQAVQTPGPPPTPKPPLRQPSKSLLLGLMVDGIWPPTASKEAYLKGAFAKHLMGLVDKGAAQGVTVLEKDGATVFQMLMAQAGAYLRAQWQEQRLYNFEQKPYASLAELFKDDELYVVTTHGPKGTPCIQLRYTALMQAGVSAATAAVSAAADAVWAQGGGREQWLRGMLAKIIFGMHFKLERLTEVLGMPETKHTVFSVHKAQAGERLREAWQSESHPYEGPPWTHFAEITANQKLLPVETSKYNGTQLHVVLDLAGLLEEAPRAVAARRQRAASNTEAAAAARSPASARVQSKQQQEQQQQQQVEEEEQEYDDEEEEEAHSGYDRRRSSSSGGHSADASDDSAGAAAATPGQLIEAMAQQNNWGHNNWGLSGPELDRLVKEDEDEQAQTNAEASSSGAGADTAAGTAGAAGLAPVQRWWPEGERVHSGWAWAEACVCLVAPGGSEATQMVQHLELCGVIGVACSSYEDRVHLVQFFAPHVSVAGMVLPATAYLLDVTDRRAAAGTMALIKPILETSNIVKVCHGSCVWWRHLKFTFNISMWGHVDTQAAHAAVCAMKAASTGMPPGNTTLSLAVLLKNHGFWHPMRSDVAKNKAMKNKSNQVYYSNLSFWTGLAERPLSDAMTTCAAADVALTIPLMESLIPDLQAAATQLLRKRSTAATWAHPSMASLGGAKGTRLTPAVLQQLAQGKDSVLALMKQWALLTVMHTGPDGWDPVITSQTAW